MRRHALAAALLLLPLAARAEEPTIALTLKDHKFSPEGITIPAGTRVHFSVENQDASAAEFESDEFRAEKVLPPGKTTVVTFGPLKPGTYEFHDEYHEAASKTHLTVR
jgi:plastocyanin